MEKNGNALVAMNIILMLVVVALGVYLVVDKTKDKDNKPVDKDTQQTDKPNDNTPSNPDDNMPDDNTPTNPDNDKPNQDVPSNPDKPQVSTDKLSETFTVTVDGKKHNVKVKYHLYPSESEEVFAQYVATVYYDNQKLVDRVYAFDKVVKTESEAARYTVNDFKSKISTVDFKIIKGTNNHEFLALYGHEFNGKPSSEMTQFRNLYVFNSDGGQELVLTDKAGVTFESLPGYNKFTSNYTKIDNDSITFLAVMRSEQSSNNPTKYAVSEYKVTFGNKLTFTKVNTYKNISTEGDTPMGLNNVIK